VILVVLDEPRGVRFGGVVAAPVFREVAGYALEQLGLVWKTG
jgi:cell division protein FtsI/penicillin-binding protein 2